MRKSNSRKTILKIAGVLLLGIIMITTTFSVANIDTNTATSSIKGGIGDDHTPPVTHCNKTGIIIDGVFVSDVTVTMWATDNESGVKIIRYKLDDVEWRDYTAPFKVTSDGVHTLLCSSTDWAGNVEVPHYCNFTIQHPITKWEQLPDTNGTGIDIMVNFNGGQFNRTLADDFLCTSTGPISDVHLWGSWYNDTKGTITRIHLSIHADIPANTTPSRPGKLLWQRDFYQGDFTEKIYLINPIYEWWWDPYTNTLVPMADHNIWQIDMYIPRNHSFIQQGNESHPIVYWLDVSVDAYNGSFGWKTAGTHWNDDAVRYDVSYSPLYWRELRYPYGHPNVNQSIDMAFRITTIPSGCCFKQTWPEKPKFFLFRFKIPITETCGTNHPQGTVPITWTVTNTGTGLLLVSPNPLITSNPIAWSGSSINPARSPFLLGCQTTFTVTLQIDNCPPETHHGRMLCLFIGQYWL